MHRDGGDVGGEADVRVEILLPSHGIMCLVYKIPGCVSPYLV